jgi:hypothetical protein
MSAHHAALLVHPFFIFAVIVKTLSNRRGAEATGNVNLLAFVSSRFFLRLLFFVVITALAGFLVIFPFWQWGITQSMQTPIDHLSRHNFVTDPLALVVFFFPLYGPLFLLIPFLVRTWRPRFLGLLVSFAILLTLGLGGTTPLPRLLFGDSWEWLTYERFAFWASLTLTPFFGILFIGLKKKLRLRLELKPASLRISLVSSLTFSLFTVTALGSWFTSYFFRIQPDPIDMQPIVNFLNEGDRSHYRYLTFGFGDQFAYLNLLTSATTIDGSYHTARQLPELRESGIGQIDTSYWALNGMTAIIPILEKSGDHGVRWGFVNPKTLEANPVRWGKIHASPFVPVLDKLGWEKIETLENGIIVYENPGAVLRQPSSPPLTKPVTAFAWGVFPILSLTTTLSLAVLRIQSVQAERILQSSHSLAASMIPIALCFWIYQAIAELPHARVYFTYTAALFYIADALILFAVIHWVSTKIALSSHTPSVAHNNPSFLFRLFHPSTILLWLSALCFLSLFSGLWSRASLTSLYISLHLIFLLLLILSLRDWHQAWKFVMFGLCAALSIEIITGFIGFALQSTAFLDSFNMKFPGSLDPSMRGASVIQLESGLRILRAYGTLPHPNMLGGLTLFALLGPLSLYLEKRNYPALILFSLGLILLFLTFSRSAWLGFGAALVVLMLKSKHLDRKRLILVLAVSLLTLGLAALPLFQLVQARTANANSHSESFSVISRAWLTWEALQMFHERPLTGIGIGSFAVELSRRAGEGYIIEPVHNIFLLAGAEMGLPGLLLIIGLFVIIAVNVIKTKTPRAIFASAALTGLGIISLFDHYLWTVAPGRILLALAIGLWLGVVEHDA